MAAQVLAETRLGMPLSLAPAPPGVPYQNQNIQNEVFLVQVEEVAAVLVTLVWMKKGAPALAAVVEQRQDIEQRTSESVHHQQVTIMSNPA